MKKAVIVILALLYITITSGVVVNIHYCMGDVASVSYGQDVPDSCGKCGMKEKAGCCHTEFKVVKLDDEHFFKSTVTGFDQALTDQPVFDTHLNTYSSRTDSLISYHSPPDQRANAVYLHTTVFRI